MRKPIEIREQITSELARRSRLAVPAFAGGVLYLLSTIVLGAVLRNLPTVGVLQGLEPILRGEANPAHSPRAAEVIYVSHQAFGLITGTLLGSIAIGVLVLVLLLLIDASRFRGAKVWSTAGPLVLYGGIAVALLPLARQILSAIETHNFAVGHDFSNHAIDAIKTSPVNVGMEIVYQLLGLAFAAGMITTTLNAQRVGLLPRWMGVVGTFSAIIISPLAAPFFGVELQIIPAFWLVMMGILLVGKWSKGDPPAWEAGEARPWPSAARKRAESRSGDGSAKLGADVAPEPNRPSASRAANKRRRKRKARG